MSDNDISMETEGPQVEKRHKKKKNWLKNLKCRIHIRYQKKPIYVRYFNLGEKCNEFNYQLFQYAYECRIYLKMTA